MDAGSQVEINTGSSLMVKSWIRHMDGMRAWFELCRLPRSVAVMADPLAAALVVGAGWGNLLSIFMLMLAVGFLHAAAVTLNDLHDFKEDQVRYPARPLPSRRIRRSHSLILGLVLLGAGWLWTRGPSLETGQVGILLVVLILVYEFLIKQAPVAEIIPALCRSLAWLLGMLLVPVAESPIGWPIRIYLLVAVFIYALGITVLRYWSTGWDRGKQMLTGSTLLILAAVAVGVMRLLFGQADHPSAAIWLGFWLVLLALPLVRVLRKPTNENMIPLVTIAGLGMLLLHAATVAFYRGFPASLPVVLLLAGAIQLQRWLCPAELPNYFQSPSHNQVQTGTIKDG